MVRTAPTNVQIQKTSFINYDPRPPEFPGGLNNFLKFQRENLHYPENEWNSGIQGRVIIGVIVEKDGSLTHLQIYRHISPAIDSEAVRVIRLSPKWIPAKYYMPKGSPEKPARIRYTFPVAFNIIKGRKIEDAFKEPY